MMHMMDVGEKAQTMRQAEAEAVIQGEPEVLRALWEGRLPKGDARAAAQLAGILAAKRTPELLPMCHPIRLDKVEIRATIEEGSIRIRAIARAHDRTGVEMEALTAAAVAALTFYDWAKSSDPTIEFTVRLLRKSGGKSGNWENPAVSTHAEEVPSKTVLPDGVRVGILTVSDRASRGVYPDRSGDLIQQWLTQAGASVCERALVSDERSRVEAELVRIIDAHQPDLVLTTGGTGLSPRDCTPEATRAVVEREATGIVEWLRQRSAHGNSRAYLSRATAGIRGRTLVINLPGSPRAVQEHLDALRDMLPHAIEMVRGMGHPDGEKQHG